jgi:4-diphosphocytidyl-2-C-methyl-D-erythritol kinase
MIAFPFAKINLGLHVLRKRNDGYHDMESVLVPIPLQDALEVVGFRSRPDAVELARSGLPVPGDPKDDLCLKAVALVRKRRALPGLRMHLHKAIPIGAGLGGGSSDATHTLLLLNDLFRLRLSKDELLAMAAELGSDCPFFLQRVPQFVEGRGERVRQTDVLLKGSWLVLVNSGIHVSTADAFGKVHPMEHRVELSQVLSTSVDDWQDALLNDLEAPVFAMHPALGRIKQGLLAQGAVYAAMSGSGSSVFGLFRNKPQLREFPTEYSVWTLPL